MEHEVDNDINCNGCTWNEPQKLGKETGRPENKKTNKDYPNYSIDKIVQNT